MRFFILPIVVSGVALTAAMATLPEPADTKSSVENSVVKIFSTVRYFDLGKPWTKQAPKEITASGVVMEGKRILTNAHAVLYASQIEIQPNQSANRLPATVEYVAPGMDLALLKLEDEKFFETHPPLSREMAMPKIKDAVMVYGYPTGGDSLSITKGIVSRIEFTGYNMPAQGLRIQIDAAINPGNSGGPAVVDGKMIGIAYSRMNNADNIGYIIPGEEIELFLHDCADGKYSGKPTFFDELQTIDNPILRPFLKIDPSVHGIIVSKPFRSEAEYPLKKWDIITRIADTPVDDQGMISLSDNVRVHFNYLVQTVARDGKVPLTIVRDGREMKIQLPVSPDFPLAIPSLSGAYPSYFIYGPLVFTEAISEFLGALAQGDKSAMLFAALSWRGSPLIERSGDKPSFPGERLVMVCAPFFPHPLAKGYSNPVTLVVKSVNGIPIHNLAHLAEVLRDMKDEFVTFDFADRGSESPVFPRLKMLAATEDILTDNGIRSQGSPDVIAVWNAAP